MEMKGSGMLLELAKHLITDQLQQGESAPDALDDKFSDAMGG